MGPVIRRRASQTGRATRATSLATALALGLSGLLAMPAGAKDTEPSDLVEACTDAPSAEDRFNDYNSRSPREKTVINCLNRGYTGNKSDQDYVLQGNGSVVSFDATISRAQFAAILNRVADYIGVQVHSAPSTATFADVPTSHFFFGEIEELAARGLTKGVGEDASGNDIYNPNGAVSYAQVLGFVHRLLTDPNAGNLTLAANRSKGQANSLDCGFFNGEKAELDNAGFLLFANTPNDCKASSPRGLVFDLIAVSFDEAVQQDVIENPHVVPAGSIALSLDRNSASTNESVTATVKVLDHNGVAISGQAVEVFAVKSSDAFDGSGNPKAPTGLNVAGTGRHGTGTTPAQIDGTDPVTNGQGVATASIISTTGEAFDVYAFVGDNAVVWKDVKGTADATSKQTATWTAVPANIVVTSSSSPTNTLQYGASYVMKFQLVDDKGNPVKRSGIRIDARVQVTDDCADVTNNSTRCSGAATVSTAPGLLTNDQGLATTTIGGPSDPDATNGTANDGVNGGDESVASVTATMPAQDGLAALSSTDAFEMKFLDAAPGTVKVATWEFMASSNPNPNKLDEVGRDLAEAVDLRIKATDFYGTPAAGVAIRIRYDQLFGAGDVIITTGGNGEAVYTIPAKNSAGDRTYNALVNADRSTDAGGSPTFGGSGDFNATSPTGGTGLTVHWLGRPSNVGPTNYSSQDIIGHSLTGSYVDLHGADVRVGFDSGDVYTINGEAASMSAFTSALTNDAGSNDTVSVNYVPNGGGLNGQSQWTLTVNGASGPVGTR